MPGDSYDGENEQLVIAFDIGTTYSGASFCHFKPGEVPEPLSVTKFPGATDGGTAKIPTVVCYDSSGRMFSAGAECFLDHNIRELDKEGSVKVEWFKLRMCPGKTSQAVRDAAAERAIIPKGKTLLNIYGDFMRYMPQCTKEFFERRSARGKDKWAALFPTAHFVLGHPNGWEGAPQAKLRKAAVEGGLVPDTVADRSRIHFVTEGEASLHFCLGEGLVDEAKEVSTKGFILADFGGGTIDLSTYKATTVIPLCVSEVVEARCLVQGSTIVTTRARAFVKAKLEGSPYNDAETLERISAQFDKAAKCRFRQVADGPSMVLFDSVTNTDPKFGIERGNLLIPPVDMASFFETSLQEAVDAIKAIKAAAQDRGVEINSVYLVGGFSASEYLLHELESRLQPSGVNVYVPDCYRAKAVAQGAIQYYVQHIVRARVAKWTYGTRAAIRYDPTDPDHLRHQDDVEMSPAGIKFVGGRFDPIVKKGTVVNSTEVFTSRYSSIASKKGDLEVNGMPLIVYTGSGEAPDWLDDDRDGFKSIMRVSGQEVKPPAKIGINPNGSLFWHSSYEIVIQFGLTEMKAYYAWEEDGEQHKTEGEIIYDEFLENEDDDEAIRESLIEFFLRSLSMNRGRGEAPPEILSRTPKEPGMNTPTFGRQEIVDYFTGNACIINIQDTGDISVQGKNSRPKGKRQRDMVSGGIDV